MQTDDDLDMSQSDKKTVLQDGYAWLVSHGEAPYQDDLKNKASYFAEIEDERGRKKIWGVDIARSIEASSAVVGDAIRLERTGKEMVKIQEEVNGKIVEREAERVKWATHIQPAVINIEKVSTAAIKETEKKWQPETLQNGAFKRDAEGAYRPAAGGEAVLIDKGDSLKVKGKGNDVVKAAIELALAKGWKSIEMKGSPAKIADAWLEAKLCGVAVTNYVPTKEDVEKYNTLARKYTLEQEDAGVQEFDIAPAAAQAFAKSTGPAFVVRTTAEKEVIVAAVDLVDGEEIKTVNASIDAEFAAAFDKVKGPTFTRKGIHSGSIVDIADGIIVQNINARGDVIYHDARKILGGEKLVKGDVVDIKYVKGIGEYSGKVREIDGRGR